VRMSKVLGPIIFAIGAIGLFFTYISPAYDTLQAFMDRETRLDEALDKYNTLESTFSGLTDTYRRFSQTDMERLELMLPDALDPIRLIIDIDAVAADNNLVISNFGLPGQDDNGPRARNQDPDVVAGRATEIDVIGTATLLLNCSGTYEDMKSFLYTLEQSLLLLDVVAVEVQVDNRRNDEDELEDPNYRIQLQTYWLN